MANEISVGFNTFTVNDFVSLLGKKNDGQFVINNDADGTTQTLKRVNRGNFLTRFFYMRQDVSDPIANIRTREALYNALRMKYQGQTEQILQFREKLGLDKRSVMFKPLECRDVKKLLDQPDAGKAPMFLKIKHTSFLAKLNFTDEFEIICPLQSHKLPSAFRNKLTCPTLTGVFTNQEAKDFYEHWFLDKLQDLFDQAGEFKIGKVKLRTYRKDFEEQIKKMRNCDKCRHVEDLTNDYRPDWSATAEMSCKRICEKSTACINQIKEELANMILDFVRDKAG